MAHIDRDPNAVNFDYSLDTHSEELQSVIDDVAKLAKLNRQKQKDALKLIILNFIETSGAKLLVDMDNNFKSLGRYCSIDVNVTTIKTTIRKLSSAGLTDFIAGKNLPYGNGIKSSITPHSDFLTKLTPLSLKPESQELVVLRVKNKKGFNQLMDYVDTPRTIKIRSELLEYNELLGQSQIDVKDPKTLDTIKLLNTLSCQRKFIFDGEVDANGRPLFNSGGRSYGPWSNLSKKDQRINIYINGNKTIEEDYQASSINVIYRAHRNSTYTGDPYEVSVKGKLVPRHIVKQVSATAINSTSPEGVSTSVGNHYRKYKSSTDPEELSQLREYTLFMKKYKLLEVLHGLLSKHDEIRHYFLKGKDFGNKLQCLEADLVFNVVHQLTKQGIPCLTVHDSFIVEEQHQATLKVLMVSTDFPDKTLVNRLN